MQVNQKLCDIVQYSPDELKKMTFQNITHPEDLDTDIHFVQEMLEGKHDFYTMEKRYIRKDGSPVWVQLSVSLILKADGTPGRFISIKPRLGGNCV